MLPAIYPHNQSNSQPLTGTSPMSMHVSRAQADRAGPGEAKVAARTYKCNAINHACIVDKGETHEWRATTDPFPASPTALYICIYPASDQVVFPGAHVRPGVLGGKTQGFSTCWLASERVQISLATYVSASTCCSSPARRLGGLV